MTSKAPRAMKHAFAAVIFALIIGTTPACAAIEKNSAVCDTRICFYWWPTLPAINGWHQDKEQSFHENANVLAPDGSTFVDAETVIYANAVYKPRVPESKTLDQFIQNDKKSFSKASIEETPPLVTADGQKIRTFVFSPQGKGNWEKIGYGEEGEFYLVFAISSRSKTGFDKSKGEFDRLVKLYKS